LIQIHPVVSEEPEQSVKCYTMTDGRTTTKK